jgi:cold shock CspA family protein
VTSRVKYWKAEAGYGFIADPEPGGDRDIFVHCSQINGNDRTLRMNEKVNFEIGPGRNGKLQAVNVERLGL